MSIAGEVSTGTAPSSATSVASIASVPLPGVIAEMMTTSDNNTAEMLLKEMGVHSGAAGSTDAGATAMTATLQQLGVDTTGMVVDDGSGLSTNDRLTCHQLITVLGQHTPTDLVPRRGSRWPARPGRSKTCSPTPRSPGG